MNTFKKLVLSGAAGSLMLGGPLMALAQEVDTGLYGSVRTEAVKTNAEVKTEVRTEVRTKAASTTVKVRANIEDKAKDRAGQEIDRRVKLLDNLSDRIEHMLKVSGETRASISATLQAQIDALVALKAKIDAETSTTSLREHIKSVTSSYRIFALVAPKAAITAYADRLNVLAGQMTTLGVKLQARIDAATSTDKTAALSAMADFNAKVADAKVQVKAALDLVSPLQPDNGDATIAASNRAKLQDARSKLEVARKDLETARKDVSAIRNALPKEVKVQVTGSANVDAN